MSKTYVLLKMFVRLRRLYPRIIKVAILNPHTRRAALPFHLREKTNRKLINRYSYHTLADLAKTNVARNEIEIDIHT